jgi:ABC-type phosphate transport system permease subunit
MSDRALSEVALVLFLITLAVNAAAKLIASGALNVRNRN